MSIGCCWAASVKDVNALLSPAMTLTRFKTSLTQLSSVLAATEHVPYGFHFISAQELDATRLAFLFKFSDGHGLDVLGNVRRAGFLFPLPFKVVVGIDGR